MNCFTPDGAGLIDLAYHYGACDHWFSSIPSQTLCNRSFVHAGTSSGYVNNGGRTANCLSTTRPPSSTCSRRRGKSWKIYCDSWLITSLALLTQEPVWRFYLTDRHDHFGNVKDFIAAAQQPGGLPSYSFIEPIYIDSLVWGAENDMHPEAAPYELYGPSNVEYGELLVYEISSGDPPEPGLGEHPAHYFI